MMSNQQQNQQPIVQPNPEGRPTKYNEDVVKKLESMFQLGVSDRTACSYAEISTPTFYQWQKDHPEFLSRMSKAKEFARIMAGQVVINAIVKDKDVSTARWWLEKKHPEEFSSNNQTVQVNTQTNVIGYNPKELTDEQLNERIRQLGDPTPVTGKGNQEVQE